MKLIPDGLRHLFRPMPLPPSALADRLGADLQAAAICAVDAVRRSQSAHAAAVEDLLSKLDRKEKRRGQ